MTGVGLRSLGMTRTTFSQTTSMTTTTLLDSTTLGLGLLVLRLVLGTYMAAHGAQKLLGWSPRFAGVDGLRKGLEQTIAWFTRQENLSRYRTNAYTL